MNGCPPDDARVCAEALAALHAHLDGELPRDDVRRVGAHLDACRRCGLEARVYRELKRLLRGSGNGLDPAVRERLRSFAHRVASRERR